MHRLFALRRGLQERKLRTYARYKFERVGAQRDDHADWLIAIFVLEIRTQCSVVIRSTEMPEIQRFCIYCVSLRSFGIERRMILLPKPTAERRIRSGFVNDQDRRRQ